LGDRRWEWRGRGFEGEIKRDYGVDLIWGEWKGRNPTEKLWRCLRRRIGEGAMDGQGGFPGQRHGKSVARMMHVVFLSLDDKSHFQ
jgi:hypothetical protein